MSPTMRRLSGRSTRNSTSFPSSRIAIRVSRGAALMRISLFIVHRSQIARRLGERSEKRFQKSPRGRATGPRYDFAKDVTSSTPHPCVQTPRLARNPHAWEATVSGTIYPAPVCFRNDDNDLRGVFRLLKPG